MKRTGNRITDDKERTLILRGVNLGGSSKLPFGADWATPEALKNPEQVSFVGRPFPLEQAEEHFEKLKSLGFTFIRLVITWEALEHSGPGIYDESYLAYLRKLLLEAEKKGISVFIDPHQDAWSRWTGGDGAPAWTLEKLGMDLEKLDAVGAALTSQGYSENHNGKPYPQMIWPVNYSLYAAATMFTLFFAGKTFAPELMIDGENAQDYLQERYIAAFRHCHRRLKHCNAIAGWGVMNEPHPGFTGNSDLRKLENATVAVGPVPSPFEAMIAASGHSVRVPVYMPWLKGWKAIGKETINPKGISLFKEGFSCPWKQAGIWAGGSRGDGSGSGDEARLLKPDHFSKYRDRPIRFTDDFLKPFMLRFIEKMNEAEKPLLFFIEGIPHSESPSWKKDDPQNTVSAFHHYDGFTLFTKSFRPWLTVDPVKGRIILGEKKTAAHFPAKLAEARAWAREHMEDMPCLLAEFGLPFDLNNVKAYKTGDYSLHEEALSLYYDGIDENLLSSTIWNYTSDNNNEDGDHWNNEDLSIVSIGSKSGSQSSSCEPRAAGGWLRPYPMATAGIPLKFTWDRKKVSLYFRFRADPNVEAPTEIFIPSRWFNENLSVSVKTGKDLRTEYVRDEQRLFIYNDGYAGEAELFVTIQKEKMKYNDRDSELNAVCRC